MALGLRIRLSAMMFLEFYVWGAWFPVFSDDMTKLGFGDHIGDIYGMIALASIFMPIIAGQITDRFIPTQVFLGFAHLAGAVGMVIAAMYIQTYDWVYWGVLLWALAYAPTIALTNSLAFTHLKDAEKDFGLIRVFGTIGWIIAGWTLWAWRDQLGVGRNDALYLAAVASGVMGIFCFTLPNTPPARSGVSPFAFLKAFALLKNPRIAVFLAISFVVGTELMFFFNLTPPFLGDLGTQEENISRVMSIAQAAEILTMLALPFFLKKFGPRRTLFLGVLAWPIRYLIFSLGQPYELIVASLALHGLCFVFFFVVAFIYMDSVAPKDIKASAQGLLTLVIYGFGMYLGSQFTQIVHDYFKDPDTGAVNWTGVFLVPSGITILCAVVLILTFPKGSMKEAAAAPGAGH